MSVIPPNLARVPSLLSASVFNRGVARNGVEMLRLQAQLTSGKRISVPSDDPVGASLISVLDERLERGEQRRRNYSHAISSLNTLDQALGDASRLVDEGRTTALSQIGAGADAITRAQQADVVQSLIDELVSLSSVDFDGLYLMGGTRAAGPPIEAHFDGFRYTGDREELRTDLGSGIDAPITITGERALGALSSRVKGDVDLNPVMLRSTRLSELRGQNGAGVALGQIEVEIDPGVPVTVQVDLSQAETVGDALDLIESAIRQTDPAALTGAFPGGVDIGATGERLAVNAAAGYTIRFRDPGAGTTASDLGLTGFNYDSANPENTLIDLDPKLSKFTTFAQLAPAAGLTLGNVVFTNGGRQGVVSVAPAMTIADFQQAVENLKIGVRVDIGSDERALDVVNEVSGWRMSVEEDGGGTLTATGLGLRSLKGTTALADFNAGKGVEIADGVLDPITGLPDPARNVDFRVTLTDGTQFDVDLTPADIVDVNAALAAINAAAAGAGLAVPADFQATLADGANGIALEDTLGGGGAISVQSLNGHAAEDLGLLGGSFSAGAPARFAGEDRAKVRVDSVLTTLIELRDALTTSDGIGIQLAGERLETDGQRVLSARAIVGGRTQRVDAAQSRMEDDMLLDQKVKSELQDVNFAEATSRLSLLGVAQQGAYASAIRAQSLSLLDFLG